MFSRIPFSIALVEPVVATGLVVPVYTGVEYLLQESSNRQPMARGYNRFIVFLLLSPKNRTNCQQARKYLPGLYVSYA